MNRFRSRYGWLMMICIAVVALRVTGLHLHLCLDGQEPAQSLHVTDAGLHDDESHSTGTHNDVDLSLVSEGLVKKVSGFDMPVLLALVLVFLCLSPTSRAAPLIPARAALTSSVHYFLPPLRAPPL